MYLSSFLTYSQIRKEKKGKKKKENTYRSERTASAIIASITTSAMAEPKFCTVKKAARELRELLKDVVRPRTSHGKRESTVDKTK